MSRLFYVFRGRLEMDFPVEDGVIKSLDLRSPAHRSGSEF